mgnify:CR=1 FL=1
MKIAIIHDWLYVYGGAERVLEQMLECFPGADVFSVIDSLTEQQRFFIKNKKVKTSYLQNVPFAKSKHRHFLPFMPRAIEKLDLTGYDIIISGSHAVACGVITNPTQLHLCYCHSEHMRYLFEYGDLYKSTNKIVSLAQQYFYPKLRKWLTKAIHRPDVLIANSNYIAQWHMDKFGVKISKIIYPGVDVDYFSQFYKETKQDYYITVGRLVEYKRFDLVINAFNLLGHKLIVIGDGPVRSDLEAISKSNIEFVGYKDKKEVAELISGARAFVFASQEAFGIVNVEAQACGTPVIIYSGGGSKEVVNDENSLLPTGVVFEKQCVEDIIKAVEVFEANHERFSANNCLVNAKKFSAQEFKAQFSEFVNKEYAKFIKSSGAL